jgi:hypothetical protein
MIRRIVEACGPKVNLRWIDREASLELRDELRILGAMRVPVVLFLTEDWFEVGRFGDRMLVIYQRKLAKDQGTDWKPPPEGETATEQAEWVDIFERMLLMTRLAPFYRRKYGD